MRTASNDTNQQINNLQDQTNDDPRIDSPEIKVIYPARPKERPIEKPMVKEELNTLGIEHGNETTSSEDQKHECKIGFQEAFKQNLIPFLGIGTALLLIGILIGKK